MFQEEKMWIEVLVVDDCHSLTVLRIVIHPIVESLLPVASVTPTVYQSRCFWERSISKDSFIRLKLSEEDSLHPANCIF